MFACVIGTSMSRPGKLPDPGPAVRSDQTARRGRGKFADTAIAHHGARKVSKTSRRTGLNSLPIVEQPALSISTSGASPPAKTQDGGSRLRTLGPAVRCVHQALAAKRLSSAGRPAAHRAENRIRQSDDASASCSGSSRLDPPSLSQRARCGSQHLQLPTPPHLPIHTADLPGRG
jgi:hypothetical protein